MADTDRQLFRIPSPPLSTPTASPMVSPNVSLDRPVKLNHVTQTIEIPVPSIKRSILKPGFMNRKAETNPPSMPSSSSSLR